MLLSIKMKEAFVIEEFDHINEEYTSKDLDHLGLVAGMCRELGLAQIIDEIIPPDSRAIMTVGECCELMCINGNGLGFTARPLYLEAQFLAQKPFPYC